MDSKDVAVYAGIGIFALILIYKKFRSHQMRPVINEYLDQNALVVDVRSPEEFRGGHCSGSVNIPLNALEARAHELDKKRPTIVCCASGGRSAMALGVLKNLGFENVINAGPWTNAVKS